MKSRPSRKDSTVEERQKYIYIGMELKRARRPFLYTGRYFRGRDGS
jgi:hypothetical protein